MAGQRLALLIANAAYEHPELKKLVAPQNDVLALEILLTRPDIGSYRVQVLVNATTATMQRTIGRVLSEGKREDTIVLFFAGHGLKHANGKLYFAGIDTIRTISVARHCRRAGLWRRYKTLTLVVRLSCWTAALGARLRGELLARRSSGIRRSIESPRP